MPISPLCAVSSLPSKKMFQGAGTHEKACISWRWAKKKIKLTSPMSSWKGEEFPAP